jgi:CBS domain containing-hemolysin-like protein
LALLSRNRWALLLWHYRPYLSLVISELVPAIHIRAPEPITGVMAYPVIQIARTMAPIVSLLNGTAHSYSGFSA